VSSLSSLPIPPRVWVLTNAPSPYQVELFSAIAVDQQINLDVRFLRDSSTPGPERRFSHRICRSWVTLSSGDELRIHGRAIWEATFGSYDLYILSGLYTSITFLACAWILYCRGKKWAIWWERPRPSKPETRGFVRAAIHSWKDSIRLWLLHTADLVIGIGSAALNEYREMGVRSDRLRMLPYCCDVSRFSSVPAETRARLRRELGWSQKLVFLFSGQMIPRKGVDVLLQAFFQLAADHADVALLLLGEGQERSSLQATVPESLKSRVQFRGHIPQAQLPDQFAIADVFAFSSRHDGWAVVLNEACGASLPIIATNQTGAAHDLVREGENGFRVEADDVNGMFSAMHWCATNRERLPQMGTISNEIVQSFSAAQGAQTFVDHVRYCLSQ
jgi:glycosyltransferase involved in cell wall biosynthesis